jgi:hypothetical protein
VKPSQGLSYLVRTLDLVQSQPVSVGNTYEKMDGSNELRLLRRDGSSQHDEQAQAFSTNLHQSSILCDLSNLELCDERLALLLLHLPRSVKTLKLGNNYCRSEGTAVLANLLMDQERRVKSIDLSLQHTGEWGGSLDLSILSAAIAYNFSLNHLDLSFNILTSDDIRTLMTALSNNNSLQSLNLCKTGLDDALVQEIGQNLPNMTSLQYLNILANRFGDSGADALLRGLQSQVTLSKLDMPRGFSASEHIDYLLAINTGGRRLLMNTITGSDTKTRPACPLALWPFILERVNCLIADKCIQASALFFLMQEPATFQKSPVI